MQQNDIYGMQNCNILDNDVTKDLLQKAFHKDQVLMAELATINTRVFLIKKEYLKGLTNPNDGHIHATFGDFSFVFLLHSHVSIGREFKEVQRVNREPFLHQPFIVRPNKILNATPTMPAEEMQQLNTLRIDYISRELFHSSWLDYWMTNSEHYSEVMDLTINRRNSLPSTSEALQIMISSDRRSIVVKLLTSYFLEPMGNFIPEIAKDARTMLRDEINNRNARRPMTPPPFATPALKQQLQTQHENKQSQYASRKQQLNQLQPQHSQQSATHSRNEPQYPTEKRDTAVAIPTEELPPPAKVTSLRRDCQIYRLPKTFWGLGSTFGQGRIFCKFSKFIIFLMAYHDISAELCGTVS